MLRDMEPDEWEETQAYLQLEPRLTDRERSRQWADVLAAIYLAAQITDSVTGDVITAAQVMDSWGFGDRVEDPEFATEAEAMADTRRKLQMIFGGR